jgi:pimeloyl-ACP methyl ester carboxylesterase
MAPTLDEFAGDVIDLLQALHVDHAVVGGLSMGGYLAFALFRLVPGLFSGLVLADTRATADSPEGLEARRRMIALAEASGSGAVADDLIPKALGETTRRERPSVVAQLRAMMAGIPAPAIVSHVKAMMARRDSTPLLGDIHCPCLIIVGEEDAITPPDVAAQLHRGIAGSTLEVIKRAGHVSNLEDPNAFNAVVAAFLTHRV